MRAYKSKQDKITGSNYKEVYARARSLFRDLERKTKRKPYVRSTYFSKRKVFFEYFWAHLHQKSPRDRFQRLKYFAATLDLIANSRYIPESKPNPNKSTEIIHRFAGTTKNDILFYVQIKENKRSKKLYLMSCFAPK